MSDDPELYDVKPHKLKYCDLCDTLMVICANCGNNCCNAGTKDNCPDSCADAYAKQRAFWESQESWK